MKVAENLRISANYISEVQIERKVLYYSLSYAEFYFNISINIYIQYLKELESYKKVTSN